MKRTTIKQETSQDRYKRMGIYAVLFFFDRYVQVVLFLLSGPASGNVPSGQRGPLL